MKTILPSLLALTPDPFQKALLLSYRRLRDQIELLQSFAYDWHRYRLFSGVFREYERGPLEARIIKTYHRIEKGLALAKPKPGFGVDAVNGLLTDLELFVSRFGANHSTERALNTLREYALFNQRQNSDVKWLLPRLHLLAERCDRHDREGGTRLVHRDDILRDGRIDLRAFFASRCSVRHFSAERIEDDLIREAVMMAKKAPSVCNRESGGVYVVTTPAMKEQLLCLQNGNRGFGDQADRVLVITSRLDTFLTTGERYQAWIDGGMFAMSLVYALHSLGIGSCCLNWSVEPRQDKSIHAIPGIPADQNVIMMLAIGNLPPELRIAQSPRRPVDEVLHFI